MAWRAWGERGSSALVLWLGTMIPFLGAGVTAAVWGLGTEALFFSGEQGFLED